MIWPGIHNSVVLWGCGQNVMALFQKPCLFIYKTGSAGCSYLLKPLPILEVEITSGNHKASRSPKGRLTEVCLESPVRESESSGLCTWIGWKGRGSPSLACCDFCSSLCSLQNMLIFVALTMRFLDSRSFRFKKSPDPECFAQTGLSAAEVGFLVTLSCVVLLTSQLQWAFNARLHPSDPLWRSPAVSVCRMWLRQPNCNNGPRMMMRQMTLMTLLWRSDVTAGLNARHQHPRFIACVLPKCLLWVQDCSSNV